jgi:hypothetical protein
MHKNMSIDNVLKNQDDDTLTHIDIFCTGIVEMRPIHSFNYFNKSSYRSVLTVLTLPKTKTQTKPNTESMERINLDSL